MEQSNVLIYLCKHWYRFLKKKENFNIKKVSNKAHGFPFSDFPKNSRK